MIIYKNIYVGTRKEYAIQKMNMIVVMDSKDVFCETD